MAAPKTKYVRSDAVGGGNGNIDAASGPGGNYAWTWNEFITLANLPRYGDTYYIKAGNYTLTADLDFYSGQGYAPIVVEGYNNTPGDNPTGNNRPYINAGVYDLDLGGYFYFKNFRTRHIEWHGCNSNGPATVVMNCSSRNVGAAGTFPAAFSGRGLWIDCDGRSSYWGWYVTGYVIGCAAYSSNIGFFHIGRGCVHGSVARNCIYGIQGPWIVGPMPFTDNTMYSCSGSGIYVRTDQGDGYGPFLGNIFDTCGNGVQVDTPAGDHIWLDYNNYENLSGSDVVNCSKGREQTSGDPGFFNAITGYDYRIGPSIKGQGFPKWQTFFDHILDPDLDGWSDQGAMQRQELIGETSVDRETGAEARGGSGSCVKFAPSSTVHPQVWVFQIPCGNGTSMSLNFWHKITAGFNGSLTFSAGGSGITPIVEDVVPLVDDDTYHVYASDIMTPTQNGYVTIIIRARDGLVSGNIFVDDINTYSL